MPVSSAPPKKPNELPAGRELDALVAEKVMAWTEIQHGPGCDCCTDTWIAWTGLPPLKLDDDGKRFVEHPKCTKCGQPNKWIPIVVATERRADVPEYSSQVAAAWLVMEKLNAERYFVGIARRSSPTYGCSVCRHCSVSGKRSRAKVSV